MLQYDIVLGQAQELITSGQVGQATGILNQLLNSYPEDARVLYLLGHIAILEGCNGLATALLEKSILQQPAMPTYTALGCAHKFEQREERAKDAWLKGIDLFPTAELYNNMASCYSDSGKPDLALSYLEKAEKMDPNAGNVKWNKSLALLTKHEWKEGWKLHEFRFHPEVPNTSTKRNYGCPDWDGNKVGRIVVHGEQGIGDEIMFLSILPEVLKRADEVVVECEPRLMDLVERSFNIPTYGNEAACKAHEAPFDAQVALGTLGMLFRNSDADFPGSAYLSADPERVLYWRRQFAMQSRSKIERPPVVGVAWQGGTKSTRIHQRTIHMDKLAWLKQFGTVVCLQYGDNTEAMCQKAEFVYYPESNGRNIDELAAMASACDVIVTVPQTLVHLAGALGIPTHVLLPSTPSWRYGLAKNMPWYGSVKLYRQEKDGDWDHPLNQLKLAFRKQF